MSSFSIAVLLWTVILRKKCSSHKKQSWSQLPKAALLGLVWAFQHCIHFLPPSYAVTSKLLLAVLFLLPCIPLSRPAFFNFLMPVLLGGMGRGWRGVCMKHFLCGPQSTRAGEESWGEFCRCGCARSTAGSSLTSAECGGSHVEISLP